MGLEISSENVRPGVSATDTCDVTQGQAVEETNHEPRQETEISTEPTETGISEDGISEDEVDPSRGSRVNEGHPVSDLAGDRDRDSGVCERDRGRDQEVCDQEPVMSERDRGVSECPVCLGPRTDPRYLACRHVFCKPCLAPLLEENHIRCPVCRLYTNLAPPAQVPATDQTTGSGDSSGGTGPEEEPEWEEEVLGILPGLEQTVCPPLGPRHRARTPGFISSFCLDETQRQILAVTDAKEEQVRIYSFTGDYLGGWGVPDLSGQVLDICLDTRRGQVAIGNQTSVHVFSRSGTWLWAVTDLCAAYNDMCYDQQRDRYIMVDRSRKNPVLLNPETHELEECTKAGDRLSCAWALGMQLPQEQKKDEVLLKDTARHNVSSNITIEKLTYRPSNLSPRKEDERRTCKNNNIITDNIDPDIDGGRIVVNDSSRRIKFYSRNLSYLAEVGVGPELLGTWTSLCGVGLDGQGRVVACDSGAKRVVRITEDGTWQLLLDTEYFGYETPHVLRLSTSRVLVVTSFTDSSMTGEGKDRHSTLHIIEGYR